MVGNLEGKKMKVKGKQIPYSPEARLKAEKTVSAEEVRLHCSTLACNLGSTLACTPAST